MIDAARSRY